MNHKKADKQLNILVMVHWAWGDGGNRRVVGHNGGAERMMQSLLRPLVDRGHSIDVLEGWEPLNDSYRHDGYEYDGVRVHPYRDREDPFKFLEKTDLFITHLQQTERAVSIAPWVKKPVITLCHNDYAQTAHFIQPEFVDRVYPVYNSEWMKASLERPYNQSHPNGIVVRPPVYANDYRTTPGSKVTLINLNEDKGAHIFWTLARRLPEIEFLAVVGAHGDQIIPAETPPNVEVMKHTDDMRAVYSKTRVLLMPSIYESWGRVGAEAMASGIPVIANPTDGLLENLGSAGIFKDRDDIHAWEDEILRLSDGRSWRAASNKALKRSRELEDLREADLKMWTRYVETAGWRGR